MKQYRFHFLNEESVVLTEEEFTTFTQVYTLDPKIELFIVTGWQKGLQLHNMTYFEAEEVAVAVTEGKVIIPPTPAEVREAHKQDTTERPTDLGDQLSNPDLGESNE